MNTKSLIKLMGSCALSLHLLTLSTVALAGGMDGGGGGAYRLDNGKLVTLPEFGILIDDNNLPGKTGKTYERYYRISDEVRAEVQAIESKLRKLLPELPLGFIIPLERNILVSRQVVDQENYKKIKDQYMKVLSNFGHKLNEDRFVLPAYSLNGKTYIFPDFELLSNRQKAKYLIHEFYMRNLTINEIKRLETVLKIDAIIEKALNAKNEAQFDKNAALLTLIKARLHSKEAAVSIVLMMMQKDLKRPVQVGDIIDGFSHNIFTIDASLVQDLQDKEGLATNYAEILEGVQLSGGEPRKTIDEGIKKFCESENNWWKRHIIKMSHGQLVIAACYPSDSYTQMIFVKEFGSYFERILK